MQETPQEYITRILGYQAGKRPLKVQQATVKKIERLIKGVPKKKLMTRPEPGKWSVAEILAHLADTELVAGFRIRLILGANGATIQAFDQDVWAEKLNYTNRDPKKSLPKTMWDNFGMHTERGKETVTRISEMFAGHDINHTRQIERIVARKSK